MTMPVNREGEHKTGNMLLVRLGAKGKPLSYQSNSANLQGLHPNDFDKLAEKGHVSVDNADAKEWPAKEKQESPKREPAKRSSSEESVDDEYKRIYGRGATENSREAFRRDATGIQQLAQRRVMQKQIKMIEGKIARGESVELNNKRLRSAKQELRELNETIDKRVKEHVQIQEAKGSHDTKASRAELERYRKLYEEYKNKADQASEARRKLEPGSSRARVTTANARWSAYAEARDEYKRKIDELEQELGMKEGVHKSMSGIRTYLEKSKKRDYDPKYQNPDGTFKGGFDGAVEYFMHVKGYSKESATKIAGKIAAEKMGKSRHYIPDTEAAEMLYKDIKDGFSPTEAWRRIEKHVNLDAGEVPNFIGRLKKLAGSDWKSYLCAAAREFLQNNSDDDILKKSQGIRAYVTEREQDGIYAFAKAKKAHRFAYKTNERDPIFIPVNRIRDPYQTEKALSEDKIRENVRKMKSGEPLEPVVIGYGYGDMDGSLADCHDGHHRIEAAKRVGYTHVPCIVKGTNEQRVKAADKRYREVWKAKRKQQGSTPPAVPKWGDEDVSVDPGAGGL